MQTKLCFRCDTVKPLTDFTKSKQGLSYKTGTSEHHTYCKACNAKHAADWREKRPGYRGSGRIKSIPQEDRLLMSAIRHRLKDAKSRCKKYGKDLDVDDIYLYELFKQQDRCCALTGAELMVEVGHPLCLSLDQIDPTKGYTQGNVQWLAWAVNRAKGDLSTDHFYEMCEAVMERKVQRLSKGS